MKRLLLLFLGREKFCLMFHAPAWSDEIKWYGLWCRPCGVFHGYDRRKTKRKGAA